MRPTVFRRAGHDIGGGPRLDSGLALILAVPLTTERRPTSRPSSFCLAQPRADIAHDDAEADRVRGLDWGDFRRGSRELSQA
jgi:hypothetical protein